MTTDLLPAVQQSAPPAPLSATRLDTTQWRAAIESMNEVTKFVAEGLKEGINDDYAVIPGTGTKKTLLKPGAQKICMAFNVYPRPQVTRRNLDNDHVEYEVIVELVSRNSGEVVSTGVGICSTKETKYRYRGSAVEDTGEPSPKRYFDLKKTDFKAAQALIGGAGFTVKKNDAGRWTNHKVLSDAKQENPDIADTYNTVLKMAEKRGLMDATLNLSCISQHFTQDLDEKLPLAPKESEAPQVFEPEIVTPEDVRVDAYNAAFESGVDASGVRGDDAEKELRASIKGEWQTLCKRHGVPVHPAKQTDEQNAECVREFRELLNTRFLQEAAAEAVSL